MAPAMVNTPPGPGPRGRPLMASTSVHRSTRHHRCDYAFLELLEEDFGIPYFALSNAFMGVPAEPKKAAISLCEWAVKTDDLARALLSWARKNGRGTFAPAFFDSAGDQL